MRSGADAAGAPRDPAAHDHAADGPASAGGAPRPGVPRSVQRLRLAGIVLALWLITFSQSSGLTSADTKLDLVVSPLRFLHHALAMWDPTAASGQMQDQAYGYLFPMGPAFLLGKLTALPAWVIQRAWASLLVTAAFLGTVRLARSLGVPGFWPRVGAGLAFALAPRVLSELSVISAELLPCAALPWVLEPLVTGSRTGSPRRAGARAGIAFALVGGINASAALAILPVPAIWLLSRSRGPRRRALIGWAALSTALAALWWVVPLLVLGRYSPPFLDWIESASVTTSVTDLVDVLRGTDHWQAFLGPGEWPGGWILVAAPAVIMATAAVAALGIAGIGRRATPHRGFLVACVVTGAVLVTLGHGGAVGPVAATSVRHLLDGPLNAFRNVHKFDPVLRLPLAIGVGHAVAALATRVPRTAPVQFGGRRMAVFPRALVTVVVLGLGAVAIAPALTGDLVTRSRSVDDPSWWHAAGQWLGSHGAAGRALVVPGAAQPTYVWGAPRDDALQPDAAGPWAVRDAAPLGQPGYVRLLDAVEAVLAEGRPAPELAPLLARAGIGYLVVRNDLDTQRSSATALRYVHATIDSSPGWSQVAAFGDVFSGRDDPARLIDQGLTASPNAVQIYRNPAAPAGGARAALLPAAGAIAATGSSDELPALVSAGLPGAVPVLFGAAAAAVQAAHVPVLTVATDGIRRREFRFGGVDQYSATMTAQQAFVQQRAVHDYLPADPGPLSTVAYTGVADVRASSSAADAGVLYLSAADGPWAAVDGNPASVWRSARFSAVGQWLEVDLRAPAELGAVQVAFATGSGPLPSRVRVTTDAGSIDQTVAPAAVEQPLQVPVGSTQFLRITALAMADGSAGGRFAISDLSMADVHPERTLDVPVSGTPDVLSFSVAAGSRPACLTLAAGTAACDGSWAAAGEEDGSLDRSVTVTDAARYGVGAELRFVPGTALDAQLDLGNPLRAIASTTNSDDPRERPGAAVDGDLLTGWVARPGDRQPALEVSMPRVALVQALTILPITAAPVTAPTRVLIVAGSEVLAADLPPDGVVRLPRAVRTKTVRITVLAATARVSTDSLTGVAEQLPVGIGEVRLTGVGVPTAHAPAQVSLGCRSQILAAGSSLVGLRVDASAADVLAGRPVAAQACGIAQLAAGRNAVRLTANALLTPLSVTLSQAGSTLRTRPTSPGEMQVGHWSSTSRTVQVATVAPALLVVHENANAGWVATLHGRRLTPVTVDGWQQGWLLPSGAVGTVRLTFTPQRSVDIGFVAGAVALLALAVLAWRRPRRTEPPPLADGVLARRAVVLIGVGALGLLGGGWGLAVAVTVWVVLGQLRSRSYAARTSAAAAVAVGLAGIAQAIGPPGSAHPLGNSRGVQLLGLVALALLALGTLPPVVGASPPGPAEPAQQGPLDEAPRRGRSGRRRQRREQVERGEMAGEDRPPERPLDGEQ